MKILNIFKRQWNHTAKQFVLQSAVTFYPDKIIIETIDRVKEDFGISSLNISILPVNTDNETLGSSIRYHLSLTRTGISIPKDYKQSYKEFLKKLGFKNGKEHHKDALKVMISQHQNQITISPTKNGGFTGKDRGFLSMKDVADIFVNENTDNFTLGDKIREGYSQCK